jgi:hypothetical protein
MEIDHTEPSPSVRRPWFNKPYSALTRHSKTKELRFQDLIKISFNFLVGQCCKTFSSLLTKMFFSGKPFQSSLM